MSAPIDPVDSMILDQARGLLDGIRAAAIVVLDDTTGALSSNALCSNALSSNAQPLLAAGAPLLAHCDSIIDERSLQSNGVQTVATSAELPATMAALDLGSGPVLALARLPKAVGALAEYAEILAASGVDHVVAGGRVKHMTRSQNDALGASFAHVRASLGRQKCRALLASGPIAKPASWPRAQAHTDVETPAGRFGLTLSAHGATFGGTGIDLGTRLLLKHLDPVAALGNRSGGTADADGSLTVDLGCGNGTIAVALSLAAQQAGRNRSRWQILATDVSAAAVAATAESAATNGVDVEVTRADGLTELASGTVDLITCNPPFHVGTAKDSGPALAMFTDAARVLRPGGQFWCVFNSHLPWLARLRSQLGPTAVMAQNHRFTVTCSTRSASQGR